MAHVSGDCYLDRDVSRELTVVSYEGAKHILVHQLTVKTFWPDSDSAVPVPSSHLASANHHCLRF